MNNCGECKNDFNLCNDCIQSELKEIERLTEENKLLKETVLTQKDYIELLIDELNETIPIAYSHGWQTTRFEKGKGLRSKILELAKYMVKENDDGIF